MKHSEETLAAIIAGKRWQRYLASFLLTLMGVALFWATREMRSVEEAGGLCASLFLISFGLYGFFFSTRYASQLAKLGSATKPRKMKMQLRTEYRSATEYRGAPHNAVYSLHFAELWELASSQPKIKVLLKTPSQFPANWEDYTKQPESVFVYEDRAKKLLLIQTTGGTWLWPNSKSAISYL